LLSWGIAQFQWTPDQFFQLFDHWSLPFLWSLIAAIILTLLMQSLIQFRRPQVRKRTTVKYAVVLAVATFLLGFWCSDLLASRNRPFDSLGADLEGALSASWEANPNSESHRTVTVGELDAVRPLSAQTKKWLRNASLRITRAPAGIRPNFCQAEIEFPNGGEWTVRWQVGK
jgi:predicted PurR-regulated permease PerM